MFYEIDLNSESEYVHRLIMARVSDQTIVDSLNDYSDYDLTNRYSYLSIATDEYLRIQNEEAPDYESMSVLLEEVRYSNE